MHQRLANTMGRPEGRVTLQGKGGDSGAPSYDDIPPAGEQAASEGAMVQGTTDRGALVKGAEQGALSSQGQEVEPRGQEPQGSKPEEHDTPQETENQMATPIFPDGAPGPKGSVVTPKSAGGKGKTIFLDEEGEAAAHIFHIQPDDLIARARAVLEVGVHNSDQLAPDFEFSAPFIGPLNAAQYRHNMAILDLEGAFPDLSPRYYHFRVDPLETNRVWFTLRPVCTHTATFKGALPVSVRPTGKRIEEPPQTASLTFDEWGQVTGHTMGYVMDRRAGDTGGLGGAFGLMWAIGCPLPVPEGRPWAPSLQLRLFNTGIKVVQGGLLLVDRVVAAVMPSWLVPTKHARNNM